MNVNVIPSLTFDLLFLFFYMYLFLSNIVSSSTSVLYCCHFAFMLSIFGVLIFIIIFDWPVSQASILSHTSMHAYLRFYKWFLWFMIKI